MNITYCERVSVFLHLLSDIKVKVKVLPITGHEGPEGE